MYQILKSLQSSLEILGKIDKVQMLPAGEFFRTDRIEISGKTTEGKQFELVLEIEAESMKVSDNA